MRGSQARLGLSYHEFSLGTLSTDVFEPRTSTGKFVFFPLWSVLTPSRLSRQAVDIKTRVFLSMVRGKTTPKKRTFDFRLPGRGSKTSALKLPNIFSITSQIAACYVPFKSKLQHPPRATPGHLNFWKISVQIPPSPSQIAVQMPPPRGNKPFYFT